MKIHVHTGRADQLDDGVRSILGAPPDAPDRAPDFVALHGDCDCPLDRIRQSLGDAGVAALHGATSCLGAMSHAGPAISGGSFCAFAIWDEDGSYGSAVAAITDNASADAAAATRGALQQADRPGEAPALVWISSSPGLEEDVIAGVQSVIGADVPIVGGSAADNSIQGDWAVYDRSACHTSGVLVSVLFPSTDVSVSFQNGYAPSGRSGVLTRAGGRRIHEIDGRPAAEFCGIWNAGIRPCDDAPKQILSDSTMAPLGRKIGDVEDVPFYLLLHPATAHADGSIDLFANVVEGEELHLMTGSADSLISRAGRVAQQAGDALPEGSDIAGALVVYCGGCMLAVQERMAEAVGGINAALGNAPFLGTFTFGEQGQVLGSKNRHGNLMISCITFAS